MRPHRVGVGSLDGSRVLPMSMPVSSVQLQGAVRPDRAEYGVRCRRARRCSSIADADHTGRLRCRKYCRTSRSPTRRPHAGSSRVAGGPARRAGPHVRIRHPQPQAADLRVQNACGYGSLSSQPSLPRGFRGPRCRATGNVFFRRRFIGTGDSAAGVSASAAGVAVEASCSGSARPAEWRWPAPRRRPAPRWAASAFSA